MAIRNEFKLQLLKLSKKVGMAWHAAVHRAHLARRPGSHHEPGRLSSQARQHAATRPARRHTNPPVCRGGCTALPTPTRTPATCPINHCCAAHGHRHHAQAWRYPCSSQANSQQAQRRQHTRVTKQRALAKAWRGVLQRKRYDAAVCVCACLTSVCNPTHHAGSPLGTYEQARPNGPGVLATPMVGGGVHQVPLMGGAQPGVVTIVNTQAKRMHCCMIHAAQQHHAHHRPWGAHQAGRTRPVSRHVWCVCVLVSPATWQPLHALGTQMGSRCCWTTGRR